jgi:hypothetical protein
MYLKGGALMSLAYHSERMTGDVDYSWFDPFVPTISEEICESLNEALKRASAMLGYVDLLCKIQKIEKEPHDWKKGELSTPGLTLKIGYAMRGSAQEKALDRGNASGVVKVDISFNEELGEAQELLLSGSNVSVKAYTPTEIIAEKMRALLQQTQRKHERSRRQDVYDIALLIDRFKFDDEEKEELLKTFQVKAASRNVEISQSSFADPAVKAAAHKEWHTMQLELNDTLPDFETCYQAVQGFYESLPWK